MNLKKRRAQEIACDAHTNAMLAEIGAIELQQLLCKLQHHLSCADVVGQAQMALVAEISAKLKHTEKNFSECCIKMLKAVEAEHAAKKGYAK